MSLAKITLYGMAKWMTDHNDNLFANLNLPTGMDNAKLVNRIMFKGAEFGVVYGDPDYIKMMIGVWSDTYYHTFERWIKALAVDYDPLENYNRHEEWTDAGVENRTGSDSRTGTEQKNTIDGRTASETHNDSDTSIAQSLNNESGSGTTGTNERSVSGESTGSTSESQVSAYDAATYQPERKTLDSTSKADTASTDTNTTNSTANESDTVNTERTESTGTRSNSDTTESREATSRGESGTTTENTGRSSAHSGHLYGNIGVTTSQQMLKEEWEVAQLNIYDEAADLFLMEFCIYVY